MKISKSPSAKYYQDNKKRLQKNACEKKKMLVKRKKCLWKEKKRKKYGRKWYRCLPDDEK